jgi:hypothetical protein
MQWRQKQLEKMRTAAMIEIAMAVLGFVWMALLIWELVSRAFACADEDCQPHLVHLCR